MYNTQITIADDFVLPIQFAPGKAESWLQRLCLATLEDAIHLLTHDGSCYSSYGQVNRERLRERLAREAYDWIACEEAREPFSFENVCEVLGMCPELLRKRLLTQPTDLSHLEIQRSRLNKSIGTGIATNRDGSWRDT